MNFWNFLGLPSQKDIMGLQQAIAAQSADICRCVEQEIQSNRNCLIENVASLRMQVQGLESELRQTIQSSSVDNKTSFQQIEDSISGIIEITTGELKLSIEENAAKQASWLNTELRQTIHSSNVDNKASTQQARDFISETIATTTGELKLSIEENGDKQASLLKTELELVSQLSNDISTVSETTHDTQTVIQSLQQTIVAQSADIGCSFDKTIKDNHHFLLEHFETLRLLLTSVESDLSMAIVGAGVDSKSEIQQLGASIAEMISLTTGEINKCAKENSTVQVSLLKKKLDIALKLSADLSLLSETTHDLKSAVEGLHDNDKQIMDMTKLVLVNNVVDDLQSILINLNS